MKLLHIIAQMDPELGGVGEAIRNTVKKLNELSVYNEIICLDAPESPFLQSEEIQIQALGPGKGPWCYSTKLIPWLLKHASSFDAIVVHGIWLYPDFAVQKALQRLSREGFFKKHKKPKVFIMPHGMLDPYFQRAASRKFKAIRNWVYWKLVERQIIQNADGLLFTCEEELLLARTTFKPYKPQKEIAVGLGITVPPAFNVQMLQSFQKTCPKLDISGPYLLYIGRIHPKKGVDILIKAYNELLKEVLQANANQKTTNSKMLFQDVKFPKLVIAGPGLESPYGQRMLKMVAENTLLKDFICFPGMLAGHAKWGAFYGCEAFVLPSHQENFGIAVVEALSCGKPVLITNKVNIWREIEAEGGGLVADNSTKGFYCIMKKWLLLTTVQKQYLAVNADTTYKRYFAGGSAAERFYKAVANT